MSYIKIEIGGKERGLKFNQLAVIILAQKVDAENYAGTANYAMVYAGLSANCYVKGEERDFTFEEVCDWVDLLTQDDINKIDACLSGTIAYKKLIDENKKVKEPGKKKSKSTTVKV